VRRRRRRFPTTRRDRSRNALAAHWKAAALPPHSIYFSREHRRDHRRDP
jgi:hypothetical protein